MKSAPELQVLAADWPDYELLDTGHGKKLERFGKYVLERPEPRAWWEPSLKPADWAKADAVFLGDMAGTWKTKPGVPTDWLMDWQKLKIKAKLTNASKHVGVFPEQAAQWEFIEQTIKNSKKPDFQMLNLFGYTGVASLVAARSGAKVTHVDGSKASIGWARENQEVAGLNEAPIRWILDDAEKFVLREGRRGVKYDGIILDPPAYGRGPQGQVWKIEKDLVKLLTACQAILSDQLSFVIINAYAIELSALSLGNLLQDMVGSRSGTLETGELALSPKSPPRPLALSLFARWLSK